MAGMVFILEKQIQGVIVFFQVNCSWRLAWMCWEKIVTYCTRKGEHTTWKYTGQTSQNQTCRAL